MSLSMSGPTAESSLAPKPTMTLDEALGEAHRCLMCWDAPCIKACPTDINVPQFIKQIAHSDLVGSARTILDANILGASCARVCPTEMLCAGACVMNLLHERPIDIGRLQAFATDDVVFGDVKIFSKAKPTGYTVAVVGAGPAGLSCAAEVAKRGHDVVVYDANEQPGGLNTYGVASYKMDIPTSLAEVEFIKGLGVEIRSGVSVGSDVTIDSLITDHDAVFLGVGLGGVPALGLEGEELTGVADALDFIAEVRAGSVDLSGETVAVIGGGNTAIDAVTQASMLGADRVYLVYRRGPGQMGGYAHDVQRARHNGVEFVHWASPVRIEGGDSVERLVVEGTVLSDDGVLSVVPDTESKIAATVVLRATGQERRTSFFSGIDGIAVDGGGRVVVDENFRTENPSIWAGGDCVNGGKEVVNAVQHGKLAAWDIDEKLRHAAAAT
jgi:dihydropyrimidine dehydrogenase (NAD+) subunit PreT